MMITMTVNGSVVSVDAEPRRLLVDVLRDQLGLTGTNVGCGHGVCGSCTVLVDGEAWRSCLALAVQCDGRTVRTVEGLAESDATLDPVQQAFTDCHALQCGFCTPGFLMLIAGALAEDPDLDADEEQLTALLSSNLCRCTGYVGIRAAAHQAAEVLRGTAGAGRPRPFDPAGRGLRRAHGSEAGQGQRDGEEGERQGVRGGQEEPPDVVGRAVGAGQEGRAQEEGQEELSRRRGAGSTCGGRPVGEAAPGGERRAADEPRPDDAAATRGEPEP